MLHTLAKAPAGFPKDDWNEMVRAITDLRKMTGDGRVVVSLVHGVPTFSLAATIPAVEIIRFRNDSGETIPSYGVISAEYDEDDELWVAEQPSTTFKRSYLVNGASDVEDGAIGYAQTETKKKVLYDGSDPSFGAGYGPKPGEWALFPNYPQTAIAQGVVDSDNKIMLAHWGPIVEAYATANGSISAGSSGAISIHSGTLGSTTAISGMDPEMFNAGDDVESGDHLLVFPILGQMAFQSLCPQPSE